MCSHTQLVPPGNPSSPGTSHYVFHPGTSHYVFHPSHPSLRTNEPLLLGVNKDSHTVMTTTILDYNKIEEMFKEVTSVQDIDNDVIVTQVIDTFTSSQNRPGPVVDLTVNV